MKIYSMIIGICLLIAIAACTKNNTDQSPENPKWLNDKIVFMDTAAYYKGTVVSLYKWDDQYYYLMTIPISSCAMCEFYDYQGLKYTWTSDKSDDFQKNAQKIKVIWEKKF